MPAEPNFVSSKSSYHPKGITDNIFESDESFCHFATNYLIDPSGRLTPAKGSRIAIEGVNGSSSVDLCFSAFGDSLVIFISSQQFFYWDGDDIRLVNYGDTNNAASPFSFGTNYHFAFINNEVILTSGEYERPFKLYLDEDVVKGVWLGVPRSVASVTSDVTASTGDTYIYQFHLTRSYRSFGFDRRDLGPVTTVSITITEGVLPVFTIQTNLVGIDSRYGALELDIYRTQANEDIPYFIARTTAETYADITANSLLPGRAQIYTTTELPNEEPPLAKFVIAVSGVVFLGNLRIGTNEYRDTVYYSRLNTPYSFPSGYEVVVDQEVSAMAKAQNNLLVFTERPCYRIEGELGALTAYEFENVAGCVAPRSTVETFLGVFYVSHDGIYFTNGFQSFITSDHLRDRFSFIPNLRNMYSFYGELDRRLYFYYSYSAIDFADRAFVLDLKFFSPGQHASFTEIVLTSGQYQEERFLSTKSSCIYKGVEYRSSWGGFLSELVEDLNGQQTRSFNTGSERFFGLFHDFRTLPALFDSEHTIKFINKFNVTLRPSNDGVIEPYVVTDNGTHITALAEIPLEGYTTIGSDLLLNQIDYLFKGDIVNRSLNLENQGRRGTFLQAGLRTGFSVPYTLQGFFDVTMTPPTVLFTLVSIVDTFGSGFDLEDVRQAIVDGFVSYNRTRFFKITSVSLLSNGIEARGGVDITIQDIPLNVETSFGIEFLSKENYQILGLSLMGRSQSVKSRYGQRE